MTTEELKAFNCLTNDILVENGAITFTAKEIPELSFTVVAKGASATGDAVATVTALVNKVNELEKGMSNIAIPLLLDDWIANDNGTFTQEVAVEGITAESSPLVVLSSVGDIATEDELNSFACISSVYTIEGGIVFIASEKPSISFTVIAKCVLASGGSGIVDVSAIVGRVSELETEVDWLNRNMGSVAEQNDNYMIIGNYGIAWGTAGALTYYNADLYHLRIDLPFSYIDTNYSIQINVIYGQNSTYKGQVNPMPAGITKNYFTIRAFSKGLFTNSEGIGANWFTIGRIA
jgi:hypothetical protein